VRAKTLGLIAIEHLQNNDSYNFFKLVGDLVITAQRTQTSWMFKSCWLIQPFDSNNNAHVSNSSQISQQ
jgi:hypothetical protein